MKIPAIPMNLRRLPLALGALCLAALAALVPLAGKEAPRLKIDDTPLTHNDRPAFTFGPVVKKVSPSVVNIYTAKTVRQDARMSPLFDEPMLREFFGGGGRFENVPCERREQSLGSGVIVSEDGYILTNNHVAENADEIKVALADNVPSLQTSCGR